MMGKTQKIFNILSILVIISMMTAPVLAQPVPASSTGVDSEVSPQSIPTNPADDAQPELLLPPADQPAGNGKYQLEQVEADVDAGEAIYFVQLEAPPAVLYRGNVKGYTPKADGKEAEDSMRNSNGKFNAKSPAAVDYMNYLQSVQKAFMADMNRELGRNVDVTYTFQATLNGFSARMTAAEAARVAKMDGVKYVNKGLEYFPETDHGPAWMGAAGIWDGTATGGLPGTKGEGVIVGVIDTGIDPWNPSFADIGDDGYDHTNPWGAGTYVGVCDPGDPSYDATFPCNDKLIGAWGYSSVHGGDPRDEDGHGSHTASTAAGNVVYSAAITTPTAVYTANISGVAPHANIVMYAACCTSDALAAAKEQVVLDGVDVVNYSIGANAGSDPDAAYAKQWLAVREAGIFVATSAGNNGPADSTIGSPADLPWLTSVGANSHDRTFLNSLTVTDGTNPPLTLDGMSMTGPLATPTRVVFSSWYTNGGAISADDARLCADGVFPPGTFNGEIVVCERGSYGRVAKGQTVKDGGAGGYILAQPEEFGGGPGALAPDPHVLPAVHIDYYKYQQLKNYMAAAGNVISGTIAGSTMAVDGGKYGDVMAAFSSRGPSRAAGEGMASHIVPSVTAPGRGIWAAYHQGAGGDGDYTFNVIQGTSMSSPHVAGAGALLAALHPTWTPSEIESAMMLTARTPITNDDGIRATQPFTSGAGHVDLLAAGQTGLLMNVASGGYTDTLPSEGGNPTELNRAALGNEQCLGNCTWNRTFKSAITVDATYTASVMSAPGLTVTVDPPTFTIPAGGTQIVTVTADTGSLPYDEWVFGKVAWDTNAEIPAPPLLSEGFESATFPPTGWMTATTGAADDPGFMQGATGTTGSHGDPHSGTYYAWHNDDNISSDAISWLVSPQVAVPAGGANLSFWERDVYQTYYQYHGVWISDGSCDPADGDFAEVWSVDGGDTWTQRTIDLSAYAGDTICFAFRYEGDWMDEWYVDDVTVIDPNAPSGSPVPSVHMPLAVKPVSGIIPDDVSITTRRNAGSLAVDGFKTLEVTAMTIRNYGLVSGTQETRSIPQDSTNGDPYDNINDPGVFYITTTVAAGDKYLLAEILASEAPDIDLFVGSGSAPSAATELCSSTTPSWNEYCKLDNPSAGTYWILVQSWDASGNPPDEVTLSYAAVGADNSNLTVTAPSTVAAGSPYSVRVYWDAPTMKAGEKWYGGFDLGSDAGNPGNLGFVPVYIVREDDDVTKGVIDTAVGANGVVTATYAITVAQNVFAEDLTYNLTDTIPAGMTYVPGSVSGGGVYTNGKILWSGTQIKPARRYNVSTSLDDALCTMPLATLDGKVDHYVDLQAFGFNTNAGINGAGPWQDAGYGGGDYAFFNDPIGNVLYFTDEGYVSLDINSVFGGPYANQPIPAAGLPDANMAVLWRQMNIVYDAGTNAGVTTGIQLTSGGVPAAKLLEFDNIQMPGDPTSMADFELLIAENIDDAAGEYEIIYAYDNLTGDFTTLTTGTIGVENKDGSTGTQWAYNDANLGTLQDGMAICFDWNVPVQSPKVITYQVTTSCSGGVYTNTVEHTVNNMGARTATAENTFNAPTCSSLTMNVVGSGTVTPTVGTHTYTQGATVMLSETPDVGWQFEGWSGDVTGGTASFPLVMDSNKTVTATFTAIPTYTLSVVTVGSGNVGLESSQALTGTGSLYQTVFYSGTVVTATAYPATDWVFDVWSGAASGSANPASFVMDMNKVLTATFKQAANTIYLPIVMK